MLEDYWEILKFLTYFKAPATSHEQHGDLFDQLEEFVCYVYCAKANSIHNVNWRKLDQKLQREHKVADLASLPPCKQVLLYHAIAEIKDHRGFLTVKYFGWMRLYQTKLKKIRQEVDDGNEYVCQGYAIGCNVESDNGDDF